MLNEDTFLEILLTSSGKVNDYVAHIHRKYTDQDGNIRTLVPILSISSVKWSDPGQFLKAQGKFIFSFPCTLFYILLTPKNYKLSL